jgi:hypothetical protein
MGVTLPNFATNRARKRSKVLRLVTLNFVENFFVENFSSARLQLFLLWLLSHTKTKTEEDKSVAYSVMVWLVDPGEQAHQREAMQRTTTGRSQAPGAASGVNEPPAFTRMVYGVYESLDEAKKALSEISKKLRENEPLEITSGVEHANRIFLIPAYRVHYVVCAEVERPMDERS